MINYEAENEQLFRNWLRRQTNEDGSRRYTDNAVIAYSYALRTCCQQLKPHVADNIFRYKDLLSFEALLPNILDADNFDDVNKDSGHGTFFAAIQLYQAFLNGGTSSTAPEVYAPFYLPKDVSDAEYNADRGAEFHYEEVPMTPIQKIYYGAPGTGKSYLVKSIVNKEYPDPEVRDAHIKRVIFHPTYSYEDFVGCIKPLISLDKPLDYIYAPGPFTMLLKSAFLNPAEKFYLIIEEINRGNSPAIFGDLFQLLDRQENGKSEYAIISSDITAYFSRDPGLQKLFCEGKVWLPSNFNIIATMNTADENIFVLDNAFKRRFSLEYVRINFDSLPSQWTDKYPTFTGTKPLTDLFKGSPVENYVLLLSSQRKLNRDWPTFAMLVNHIIDCVNMNRKKNDATHAVLIAENKKLAPFFVTEKDISDRNAFLNKVIFYLKQDVFGQSDHYMTGSYEEIYAKYADGKADIFELLA
jgi:MoxR-like ATPase